MACRDTIRSFWSSIHRRSNHPERIRTQLLMKTKLPLPIILMTPPRHIDWTKVFIFSSCIAWWVGLIWLILDYKGGAA